jgi:Leucine-rich repeat (LRR) protein
MKHLFAIFFSSLLILKTNAQHNSGKIYRWEEVQNASADTVYALSFSKEKLTLLPADLSKFIHLKHLDLSKNKLQQLPDYLSDMIHLEEINLDKNQFDVFPLVLTRIPSLNKIILSNNRLNYIPDQIVQNKSLRYLDMYNNQVENVGKGLYGLKNLELLDLGGVMYGTLFHKDIRAKLPGVKIKMDPPCKCMD